MQTSRFAGVSFFVLPCAVGAGVVCDQGLSGQSVGCAPAKELIGNWVQAKLLRLWTPDQIVLVLCWRVRLVMMRLLSLTVAFADPAVVPFFCVWCLTCKSLSKPLLP
jgi:hypothetical protein